MAATEAGVEFQVEGPEDAEITLGLQEEADYKIEVDGNNVGEMKTNLGGKLTLSVELNEGTPVSVKVVKLS